MPQARLKRIAFVGYLTMALALAAAPEAREEEVTLEDCPVAVQAALTKAAEGGALRKVRKVTEGDTVSYAARIEVVVNTEGRRLPPRPIPVEEASEVAATSAAAVAQAALTKPVTLNVAAVRLSEVCALLTEATGVPVSCGNAFAGRLVTVSLKGAPFGEALEAIAQQTGTRVEAREGGFRLRGLPK